MPYYTWPSVLIVNQSLGGAGIVNSSGHLDIVLFLCCQITTPPGFSPVSRFSRS
jgi:hypothetical protein